MHRRFRAKVSAVILSAMRTLAANVPLKLALTFEMLQEAAFRANSLSASFGRYTAALSLSLGHATAPFTITRFMLENDRGAMATMGRALKFKRNTIPSVI